jgi:hypothetical protein
MTYAEQCRAARQECRAAYKRARQRAFAQPLSDVLAEVHEAARRSGRSGRATSVARPVRLERHADAVLADLRARAARCAPIVLSFDQPASTQWVDTSHSDRRAAPPGNRLLPRTYTNGNCLRLCAASILGTEVEKVPDPWTLGWVPGWLDQYSQQLAKQTGYRLEQLPASCCPPRDPNQLWIATLHEAASSDHCVVARGHFVVHDPAGGYHGPLPMGRIVDGLLIVPAPRDGRPVVSLHRGVRADVPAA